jgi:tetratricopeptide (TPR) repeat protein
MRGACFLMSSEWNLFTIYSLPAIITIEIATRLAGVGALDVRQVTNPEDLANLLGAERFHEAREAAEVLLHRGGLNARELAQVYLALSHSLSALQAGQEAVGPAELAAHFARESAEYDLLGRALCHLASLCYDNRLYKRALSCLEAYFAHFTLCNRARALEGHVFHRTACCFQAMGRGLKALEYFEKAYRWHRQGEPPLLDQHRADLAWQCLRLGKVERAEELLAESENYLRSAPNDLDARARHCCNVAYRAYLVGNYSEALDAAIRTMGLKGATSLRKAHACLVLHYTARAMGLQREAQGVAVLARIQASVARRADLEEEINRSMLQVQPQAGLPLIEELFRALRQAGQATQQSNRASG